MTRLTFKKKSFTYPSKEPFHSRDCELTAFMRWVILKSWLHMFNSFFFPFSFFVLPFHSVSKKMKIVLSKKNEVPFLFT